MKFSTFDGMRSIGCVPIFSAKFSEWIPKASKPDWLEDRRGPRRRLIPSVHVGAGEGVHVPHVESLRGGVGEHHQVVVRPLGLLQVFGRAVVGAALFPDPAPLSPRPRSGE